MIINGINISEVYARGLGPSKSPYNEVGANLNSLRMAECPKLVNCIERRIIPLSIQPRSLKRWVFNNANGPAKCCFRAVQSI
jgi:hypothetical protein